MALTSAERARAYRQRKASAGLESRPVLSLEEANVRIGCLEAEIARLHDLVLEAFSTVRTVTSRDANRDGFRDDRDVTNGGVARTPDLDLFSSSLEKEREIPPSLRSGPPNGSVTVRDVTKTVTEAATAKRKATSASPCPPSSATPAEVADWVLTGGLEGASGQEFAQFLDHHRARHSLFADWAAAWRTWRRNAEKFGPRPSGPRLLRGPEPVLTRDGLDPMSAEACERRRKQEKVDLLAEMKARGMLPASGSKT
jgi:hypothetical protein